jgi:periplasmic protein TonB
MKKLLYAGLITLLMQACGAPTTPEKPQTKNTAKKPSTPQADSLSPKEPKDQEESAEKDNNGAPKKSKSAPVQYVVPKIDPNTETAELPPNDREYTGLGKNVEGTSEPWSDGEGVIAPFDPGPEGSPVERPDVKAKFVGGDDAFSEFVRNSFIYPARCQEEGINSYVLLQFVVDTKGNISNVKAIDGTAACPEFAAEAIRVLKRSPKWIPGMVNGKFVNSYLTVPIRLNLD